MHLAPTGRQMLAWGVARSASPRLGSGRDNEALNGRDTIQSMVFIVHDVPMIRMESVIPLMRDSHSSAPNGLNHG
jgi:hypothetical protein